ncbi:MAG: aldose epimerase family protein [Paracoccaceae bacterium]
MQTRPKSPGLSRLGLTANGQPVERIVLADGRLAVSVLTFGAALQGLWLDAVPHSLTLGSDRLADYEAASSYFGALVGPVANRIAGANATIVGRPCRFDANEGANTLHSGASGLHRRLWRVEDRSDTAVTFALDLADGLGGFPGNRRLSARFSLPGSATLRMELSGTTDAPTPINIANHSYWNLDGTATWAGHSLQIKADRWLPVDTDQIPTGRIAPATGALDFRRPRPLGPDAPALDHNFCLATDRRALAEAATLTGASGARLRLMTTEPGLQVYDGRAPVRPGDAACAGLALEPQAWPDALHQPTFPDIIATPDSPYRQITEWRFSIG